MTIFANRYEIVRKLGEGGMGEVWLGLDLEMDRQPVALKFVRREMSSDTRAIGDIRREVINSQKLTNPGIVRVHYLNKHESVYFITMEYVEGENLNDRLARYKDEGHNFSEAEVLEIARFLCPVIDYAHEQRVLHLDIKPSNIIAVKGGGYKIMDFGISGAAHESMTRLTRAMGYSSGYAPPEQITGRQVDRRSDVYSLAATFYDLLAGKPPCPSEYAAINVMPEAISGVSPVINSALLAGLSKDPEERPRTAGMLLGMLECKTTESIVIEPKPTVPTEPQTIVPTPTPTLQPTPRPVPAPSIRRTRLHALLWGILISLLLMATVIIGANTKWFGFAGGKSAAEEDTNETYETKVVGPELKLVRVSGGTFRMGSNENEWEIPVHTVTVGRFWMGEVEVTVGQYVMFLNEIRPNANQSGQWISLDQYTHITQNGNNYYADSGWENHPMVNVSWYGAEAFCKYYGLRLPTESEWEYAAGGSNHYRYPWGNEFDSQKCCCIGNQGKGSPGTMPVKSFTHNDYGLYDMAGNVWEWCSDWYDVYPGASGYAQVTKKYKVLRGGSWYYAADNLRCSSRGRYVPTGMSDGRGFRVAGD